LRTGFRTSERTSLGLTYSLIQDDTEIADIFVDHDANILTPDVNQCDPVNPGRPLLCDQEGTFLTSVLGFTFNWDRRDSPIRATRGFDLQVSQDVAGLGGEVNYLRTEIEGGVYYGLPYGFRASFRGSAGVISGWNGDTVRINDRFFKGGSSFRGFDVAGIGPRQLLVDDVTGAIVDEGDAVGGNAYAIGTLQLDVPVPLPESFGVGGALFVDFGTLGYLDAANRATIDLAGPNRLIVDDSASLRVAAGVSVFWDSPFGPVQFDFAQPLQHEDYDDLEEFRFSTRTQF
jgi:outer membrane protein insertion porin family